MNINESREKLFKTLIQHRHLSLKQVQNMVKNHEEVVISDAGIADQILKQNNPIMEKRLEALENFIGALHGRYICDVDPTSIPKKDLKDRTVQLDVEKIFGIKLSIREVQDVEKAEV
jgi:hypothetical protein